MCAVVMGLALLFWLSVWLFSSGHWIVGSLLIAACFGGYGIIAWATYRP